jgi:hypothetical protein
VLKLQNQFTKGEQVEVLKAPANFSSGTTSRKKATIYRGQIEQVCNKFVVVNFGQYKESFTPDQVRKVS